jgi:hypothetical protein
MTADLVIAEPDRIAILTVTRGRPEQLRRMLEAMEATIARKDLVEHWLLIDDDDDVMLKLAASKAFEALTTYPQHWLIRPRPRKLADAWNAAWSAAKGRPGIFIGFTDDYEMKSPGWDEAVRRTLNAYGDRVALGHIPDALVGGNRVTIICGTSELFDLMGYFVVPYFPFWFMDAWVDEIARLVLRRPTISIDMAAQEPDIRRKTKGMRNLPFWFAFFCELDIERREIIDRIRRHIY